VLNVLGFLPLLLHNKKLCCQAISFNEIMMEKTNVPRLILSRLDKLSPSVFIKRVFLTRELSLVFFKNIPTSQVGLEISPFNSNVGHNFLSSN